MSTSSIPTTASTEPANLIKATNVELIDETKISIKEFKMEKKSDGKLKQTLTYNELTDRYYEVDFFPLRHYGIPKLASQGNKSPFAPVTDDKRMKIEVPIYEQHPSTAKLGNIIRRLDELNEAQEINDAVVLCNKSNKPPKKNAGPPKPEIWSFVPAYKEGALKAASVSKSEDELTNMDYYLDKVAFNFPKKLNKYGNILNIKKLIDGKWEDQSNTDASEIETILGYGSRIKFIFSFGQFWCVSGRYSQYLNIHSIKIIPYIPGANTAEPDFTADAYDIAMANGTPSNIPIKPTSNNSPTSKLQPASLKNNITPDNLKQAAQGNNSDNSYATDDDDEEVN